MSKYFTKSNKESTVELFNKRTIYRMRAYRSVPAAKNIIDFNLAEKCFYGKVDYYYSPIYLYQQGMLKPLRGEGNHTAINFVADLFNEMASEFDRCVVTGQISKDDPFLSSLRVFKSFEDPQQKYNEYKALLFANFRRSLSRNNIEIENFDHFLEHFMKIMPRFSKSMPFTFPAYIKTRENSILTSGLAIEIADLSYENDEEKKKQFLQSRNWAFFVNACNKYGFMIDYNVPWRIVCDIKAEEIHPYIAPYFNNASALLSDGYTKASMGYLNNFVGDLNQLYQKCIKKLIVKIGDCDGKTTRQKIRPPRYTIEQLYQSYGLNHFLKLYMRLRLCEEKPEMPIFDRHKLIKDVMFYMPHARNPLLVIEHNFERIINKPFDKRYSSTYNINVQQPAIAQRRSQTQQEEEGFSAQPITDTINNSGY